MVKDKLQFTKLVSIHHEVRRHEFIIYENDKKIWRG